MHQGTEAICIRVQNTPFWDLGIFMRSLELDQVRTHVRPPMHCESSKMFCVRPMHKRFQKSLSSLSFPSGGHCSSRKKTTIHPCVIPASTAPFEWNLGKAHAQKHNTLESALFFDCQNPRSKRLRKRNRPNYDPWCCSSKNWSVKAFSHWGFLRCACCVDQRPLAKAAKMTAIRQGLFRSWVQLLGKSM